MCECDINMPLQRKQVGKCEEFLRWLSHEVNSNLPLNCKISVCKSAEYKNTIQIILTKDEYKLAAYCLVLDSNSEDDAHEIEEMFRGIVKTPLVPAQFGAVDYVECVYWDWYYETFLSELETKEILQFIVEIMIHVGTLFAVYHNSATHFDEVVLQMNCGNTVLNKLNLETRSKYKLFTAHFSHYLLMPVGDRADDKRWEICRGIEGCINDALLNLHMSQL